ncbi:MAG: MBOAT family O-acyltransferase, partial [Myxococcota bacterium]|nr:MBOAT family O-acyltransferase [Myxococcota bacterium]
VGEFAALLGQLGLPASLPVLKLVLPVGLSFYTFQSMGYTIDVHRGKLKACRNPLDFALFVAFFPQLVAGPIERAGRLLPQLQRPRQITRSDMAEGAQLVLWGYFKKLFVADNLAGLVQRVFEGEPGATSGWLVLLAAYAFSWQLYCDFSGYTDIARGLARMMGVELTINFRLPFFASGPRDLWRRWHVSLSGWLRDYLYIPLGGNRRGRLRSHVAMMVTMVLGGLWHGASWTFAIWGLYHGLALLAQRLAPAWRSGPATRVLAIVAMFHVTVFGFLIFRAHDLAHVVSLLTTLLTSFAPRAGDGAALIQLCALVAVPLFVEIVQYLRGEDLNLLIRLPAPAQAALSTALILAIVVLGSTHGQKFIYFQF